MWYDSTAIPSRSRPWMLIMFDRELRAQLSGQDSGEGYRAGGQVTIPIDFGHRARRLGKTISAVVMAPGFSAHTKPVQFEA